MDKSKVSDNILIYLKYNGPQTAQQLSAAFEVTPMAIRQHLYIHNKNGLVDFYDVKSQRGRPKRLWQLTTKSQLQYANNAAQQMSLLMSDLISSHSVSMATLKKCYVQTLLSRYPKTIKLIHAKARGIDFDLVIGQLAKEANQLGYLFEYAVFAKGEYKLIEHHEPLHELCSMQSFIKEIEINKFQVLLGQYFDVTMINHILIGHFASEYHLIARNE